MQHHRLTLENGLRIVHIPMPVMRSVTLAIFVGVGSRHESAQQAGIAHLIEHMLFKGTARRPRAADISETLDSVGGILNASTDKEVTLYWAKVAREHLPLAVDLLADMLRCSRLTPTDLTKEKSVVLEELNMLTDDPQEWVHVLADEALWPRQGAGREVAGTRASVQALRRRDLVAHLNRYYGANNAVISLAGGVDLEEALRVIREYFGDWTQAAPEAPAPAYIPDGAPRLRMDHKPTEQVNLCLAFPGFSRYHPDRWALDVLCTILGGGTSSRLFLRLRERLGLAYDIHAYSTHLSDTGSIVVYAGVDRQKTEPALGAIFQEVDRLQRRRVSDDELRKAKQYLRGRLWLGLEDTYAVAHWFGAQEILEHDVVTPAEAADATDAVSAADLLRVARTYLQPELSRLAAVGPVSDLALEARLEGA